MSNKAHEALETALPAIDSPILQAVIKRVLPIALRYWNSDGPPNPDMAIIVSKDEMLAVARSLYWPEDVRTFAPPEGVSQSLAWIARRKAHKFNMLITLFGFRLVCER